MLAAWAASWSLGGQSRAAQALSALQLSRLLGIALLQSAQQQQPGAGKLDAGKPDAGEPVGSQPAAAGAAQASAPSSPAQRRRLAPPSPGKDISSYRLPDRTLPSKGGKQQPAAAAAAAGAASQQPTAQQPAAAQRWSMDAAPSASRPQVRAHAKPRTSLDFDATPASPPAKASRRDRAAQQQLRRSRRSVADHRAAPRLAEGAEGAAPASGSPARRREKQFRPRMQRIASGQELAELAAGRRSTDSSCASSESGRSPTAAAAPGGVHPSLAAAVAASAPAGGPAALSSWLPTRLLPAWAPEGGSGANASARGEPPTSPRDTAAAALDAVARWATSTGTAAAAWTGSALDAALRPLVPGGGPAALAGATSLLWRSPSAPQRATSAGGEPPAAAGLQTAPSAPLPKAPVSRRGSHAGSDRRRLSVDGASPRHYTHGGVTADPNRLQALENLAAAARLQSCATLSRLGPGHVAVAAGGPAAGVPLGADAGASALASVGLDGDCPQVGGVWRAWGAGWHCRLAFVALHPPPPGARLQPLGQLQPHRFRWKLIRHPAGSFHTHWKLTPPPCLRPSRNDCRTSGRT